MTQDQICSLAEVLEEEEFDDDEAIVEQGEKDDKMFILRSGQAVACIAGEKGEIEVKQYSIFGRLRRDQQSAWENAKHEETLKIIEDHKIIKAF